MAALVGYDIDGVLCPKPPARPKPYSKQKGAERKAYAELREFVCRHAPLVRRPGEARYVLVSGRNADFLQATEDWARANGLKQEGIYLIDRPRTSANMAAFKAETIKRLGIVRFYEDDKRIGRKLMRLCPGVTIIQIPPARVDWTVLLKELGWNDTTKGRSQ
jgi:hypothetical protein